MKTLRELKTEKGRLFNELNDVYNVAKNESRSLSSDELQKADKIMEAMDEKDRQIRNLEAFASRKAEFENTPAQGQVKDAKQSRSDVFNKYLRYGMADLNREDHPVHPDLRRLRGLPAGDTDAPERRRSPVGPRRPWSQAAPSTSGGRGGAGTSGGQRTLR